MSVCTRCKASCDGYGCPRCTSQLRDLLADLPWWLDELETTATGGGKTSAPVRRTPRYRKPLDGDAHPISAFPADEYPSAAHACHDREQAVLRDALARGRVNARASELAERVQACLTEWVRDLCETRGLPLPSFDKPHSDAGPNAGQAPWVDASTVHVAAGNPGELCGECWTWHRGGCL